MYEPADGFDDGEFIVIDNWEVGMVILEGNEKIPYIVTFSEDQRFQKFPYQEIVDNYKIEATSHQGAILAFKDRMEKAFLSRSNIEEIRELIKIMRRLSTPEQEQSRVNIETY